MGGDFPRLKTQTPLWTGPVHTGFAWGECILIMFLFG